MKLFEFLKEKKWHIISGVVFLAIFAVIAGLLLNGMESRFTGLKAQIDQISSGISSLEVSSAAFKSSVDGLARKPLADTSDQSNASDLQSKLDDILVQLSDLKKAFDSLKVDVKNEIQGVRLSEGKISVPDTKVPESPAKPNNPDTQPQPANTVKSGQDFTITVKAGEVSNLYGYQFNLNYDNKKAAYKGSLKSSISTIGTIFKKDMPDHLLVGATMVGNTPGYSGRDVTVCTMVFTATSDIDLSTFTINGVNTVDANQKYIENTGGWSVDAKAK